MSFFGPGCFCSKHLFFVSASSGFLPTRKFTEKTQASLISFSFEPDFVRVPGPCLLNVPIKGRVIFRYFFLFLVVPKEQVEGPWESHRPRRRICCALFFFPCWSEAGYAKSASEVMTDTYQEQSWRRKKTRGLFSPSFAFKTSFLWAGKKNFFFSFFAQICAWIWVVEGGRRGAPSGGLFRILKLL